MVAMTENGPIPDIDEMIEDDAMWLYFSSWVDLVALQNSETHIKAMYVHNKVITLDEVAYSQTPTFLGAPSRRIRLNPMRSELFDLLGRRTTVRPDLNNSL